MDRSGVPHESRNAKRYFKSNGELQREKANAARTQPAGATTRNVEAATEALMGALPASHEAISWPGLFYTYATGRPRQLVAPTLDQHAKRRRVVRSTT